MAMPACSIDESIPSLSSPNEVWTFPIGVRGGLRGLMYRLRDFGVRGCGESEGGGVDWRELLPPVEKSP